MDAPRADAEPAMIFTLVSGFGSIHRDARIDMLQCAVEFAQQLRDLYRTGICPKCFYVYARALSGIACEEILSQVLARVHEFWDACAVAVSLPGSYGDISALRAILDSCMSSCRTAHLHPHAQGALRDSASCLMDSLCRCLSASLRGGSHKKQQNVFLSKRGMWPPSVGRVMPNGVGAYARWACMIPTRYPLALLARLTIVARREVMTGLLQSPARERVVATLVRILRRWHMPDAEFPASIRDLLRHDVSLGRPSVEEATSSFGLVVHFISVFQTGPDRHLDDFPRFTAGFERQLHDAIVDIASSSVWKNQLQLDCIVRAASSLCANGDLPVHPIVKEFRETSDVQQFSSANLSVGDAVYIYLQQKMDSRFCSGPACSNYARETDTGRHSLLLCANCKVMRYCGLECQRLDWSVGKHESPHKIVCSAVRKFVDAGLLKDLGMKDFSVAFFERGFLSLVEFAALGRLALVDDTIPNHVQVGALAQMLGVDVDDLPEEIDFAMAAYQRLSADPRDGNAKGGVETGVVVDDVVSMV